MLQSHILCLYLVGRLFTVTARTTSKPFVAVSAYLLPVVMVVRTMDTFTKKEGTRIHYVRCTVKVAV